MIDSLNAALRAATLSQAQAMVLDFHRALGIVIGESPKVRSGTLRASLIEEEAKETADALRAGDLTAAIDGMCDVIYVALGAAIECGVDLSPFFAEVHRSNMAKVGGPTRPDGKVLKPAGWKPPDIAGLLTSGASATDRSPNKAALIQDAPTKTSAPTFTSGAAPPRSARLNRTHEDSCPWSPLYQECTCEGGPRG